MTSGIERGVGGLASSQAPWVEIALALLGAQTACNQEGRCRLFLLPKDGRGVV